MVKVVRQCNVSRAQPACERLCPHTIDAMPGERSGRFTSMHAARQLLGEKGERIAEGWLASRGCILVERRCRSGHRDSDLVVEREAVKGGSRIVAFVEVKTR